MSSITYSTREEWLLARRSLVTASDVASILGVDPHRDALAVYADKIGAGEQEDSLVMRRGRRFEAAIAEEFAEQFGVRVVDPGLTIFRHEKYEWLGATLDRHYVRDETRPDRCRFVIVPLQIKLGLGSYGDWKAETPRHYQVQVLTEAAVVDAPFGTIAGLIGPGPLMVADIPYDEELFELIVPRLREFLDRVERRDPPEPTSGMALEPLRRLYPGADGRTIELAHLPLRHKFQWAGDDPRKNDGVARCGYSDNPDGGECCWMTEPEHAERYAGVADEWERAKEESKRQDEIASGCQAVLRHQLGSAQWAKLSDGTYLERKINKAGADSIVRFRPKRKT